MTNLLENNSGKESSNAKKIKSLRSKIKQKRDMIIELLSIVNGTYELKPVPNDYKDE